MFRIKYRKDDNINRLVSTSEIISEKTGAIYKVYISLDDYSYRIKNIRSEKIVKSNEKDNIEPPTTSRWAKVQVKRALESLGVKFSHEFRNLDKK